MATRILLVEDEANMARTLAKNLERAGHRVEHAPNGAEALTRLATAPFDLVLTDLKMPVMVSGLSGTGKELVARPIHARGPLADRRFVAINCAGLSETLLDSQLFGHRRGAFTGAVADHDGVFRAAEGGTLFLDEVSEIPLALQAKFLRALQDREVTPLGSSRPITVDVRLDAPDGAALPTLGEAERRLIAAALRHSGGNKNEAARLLGIDRQRLYRKIEKYGLT